MTQKQKMLAGELYNASDPELAALHDRAIELCEKLNFGGLTDEERVNVTRQLLGKCGKRVVLGRDFWCDYGFNIEVGENFYVNYGVVILDVCKVTIGKNCLIRRRSAFTPPAIPSTRLRAFRGWSSANP